jgi:hypothetical protein
MQLQVLPDGEVPTQLQLGSLQLRRLEAPGTTQDCMASSFMRLDVRWLFAANCNAAVEGTQHSTATAKAAAVAAACQAGLLQPLSVSRDMASR